MSVKTIMSCRSPGMAMKAAFYCCRSFLMPITWTQKNLDKVQSMYIIRFTGHPHAITGGQLFFRTGAIAANQYDLFTVTQHETDEVLGSSSAAFGFVFNAIGHFTPADLFRYHSDGTRSLAAGSNTACTAGIATNACFSLNGVTMLHQYHNTNDGADAGDWQTNCTNVQDAFGCQGTSFDIATDEITLLDVIGYNLQPPADMTIIKTHTGNFTQGQVGAMYTITVTNSGTGPTVGTVTVTDTVPAGLTATAIAGTGWTCTQPSGPCTRTDVLAAGASYPAITLTVNVAANAPATVTNTANVAGGGETNTGNNAVNDPTTILVATIPPDAFIIRYAANLTAGDSVIDITNTGANGASLTGPGFGGAAGNICVNVYAFSPDEQLVSCCSCLITPNGLVSLSVNQDMVSNTLTGVRPNSIVVKLLNTGAAANFTGTNCTNSAALAGTPAFPLAGGVLAFGTTLHAGVAAGAFNLTETPFIRATLSPAELASITNRCTNIIGNGSTFGICRSCRVGGLNTAK